MRLGSYKGGFLVPYPDVHQLPLESRGFGNFRASHYDLGRINVTQEMQRCLGEQPDRIYFVSDPSFLEYCRRLYRNVSVIEVADIPDPPPKLPDHYVTATCRRCGRSLKIDTGHILEEQVLSILQKKQFGDCPAGGWHVEFGTYADYMDFDFSHVYKEEENK